MTNVMQEARGDPQPALIPRGLAVLPHQEVLAVLLLLKAQRTQFLPQPPLPAAGLPGAGRAQSLPPQVLRGLPGSVSSQMPPPRAMASCPTTERRSPGQLPEHAHTIASPGDKKVMVLEGHPDP